MMASYSLPGRQMWRTSVHHAGVDLSKPTRLLESGWGERADRKRRLVDW